MDKTSADKWELIEALYQHGTNVEALKKALPKWSTSQLNATIRRFRRRAKKKTSEDEKGPVKSRAPLEQWIDLFENLHVLQGSTDQPRKRRGRKAHKEVPKDHVPLLGKVMMYAACFEEHYQGTEPDDPNYSEIYRYLAQLLEGKEPTQLRPGSAAKVLEMLNRIKKVVTDGTVHEHMQYLQRLPISYLHSDTSKKTQANAAIGGAVNMKSSDVDPVASACPLFQDAEEEVQSMELEPEDPYYEVKREKVVKKLETDQQESATHLQFVSGLNPLEVPTKFMVKPTITTVNPSRSKVNSQGNQVIIFVVDTNQHWVTTSCLLDYVTTAIANKFGNIAVVRLGSYINDDVNEDPAGNKALWDCGLLNGASQKPEVID